MNDYHIHGAAALSKSLLCVLACLLLAGPRWVAARDGVDPALTLVQFERLYMAGEEVPPRHIEDGWQPVALKDVWLRRHRRVHREAWYRTTFDWPGDRDQALALFVPRISANASFWLNGHELGNTGPFTEPLPRNLNHPVFLRLPPRSLQATGNELYVRLQVDPSRAGMLFEIDIGPYAALYSRYSRSHFAKVTAAQILTALMLAGVAVVLAFHWTTGVPPAYRWFAFGSLFWALFSFELYVRKIPVPTDVWVLFFSSALLAAVFCYTRALHAVIGARRRWLEHLVLALIGLNVASFLLHPNYVISNLRAMLALLFIAWLGYAGVTLLVNGLRRHSDQRHWLILCGMAILILTGYDVVFAVAQITAEFAKFPYLPLIVFLAGSSVFVRRLIDTQRQRDHLASDLALSRGRQQQVIRTERERLMREIHDGVGSQLVSTLARLERSPAADQALVRSLRTSLDDLRLIVHSLEGMAQQGDVATILATVRERMEPGLNAQGLHFDWQVQPLPRLEHFDSEQALQLMRLVQEAVTNVIKHAGASRIRMRCGAEAQEGRAGVFVEIADDGSGFDPARAVVGHGLANMRHRAARLHGALGIVADASGTRVHLWLPLIVPETPADDDTAAAGDASVEVSP